MSLAKSRNSSGPPQSRNSSGPPQSRNSSGPPQSRNSSGPPRSRNSSGSPRKRYQKPEEVWIPKTSIGKRVMAGEINSMEEILSNGLRIQEAGIVKKLLPDLKTEVIDVGIIQKMTANGQSTRFKALVAAGNENGWLGIGMGKSKQMRIAIEKANNAAYLNVSPVKLGCGSWECRCDQKHSVPFKVKGKGGSVTIEILPAPRGLGLVAGRKIRNLLRLAGLKDAWTTAKGSTPTMNSTSKAVLNCLRQTFSQG